MVDAPSVRGREDADTVRSSAVGSQGCAAPTIWTTRVNGTAAYVIPKVDVLVSTVFQSVPGAQIGANFTYNKNDISVEPRERGPGDRAVHGRVGGGGHRLSRHDPNTTTVAIPLLLANEMMGERTTMFDLKLAKNIRFENKRATVGVDIYNFLNSDAINSYNATITRQLRERRVDAGR